MTLANRGQAENKRDESPRFASSRLAPPRPASPHLVSSCLVSRLSSLVSRLTHDLTRLDSRRDYNQHTECIFSPLLFNIYVEKIFQLLLKDQRSDIKVNGIRINNLRYADDTAILAENIQDLQAILNTVNVAGKEYGLISINNRSLLLGSRYNLLKIILTGKIEGTNRGQGRKQHS
ncbi:uncharacterized protein LOC105192891 [Solenopsis invicta]|uniref:uncharacterized protein LOC105192891 n=1 Tax=Solenopsis invicta TaxID=13686 RepID=UPI00193D6088|nr:uncharacterized protein LOC105192891 [Solenopsis invicta]